MKVANVVDPRFKDLKCLPRSERDEVWRLINDLSAQQCNNEARDQEPPKKKRMSLLLVACDL